jgi:hypothetical protein
MTNNDIFAALRPHILNVTGVSECILADPNGPSPDGPYASVRPRQSIRERGQANIIMTDGANDTIVYEIRAQIVASCEINFFRGEAMRYAEMLKECHKRPDVCWPLWKAGIGWGGTEPVNNLTALQASNFEGWVTEYESCESKMTISCSQHGRWVVDVSHFLNHETGCPTCGIGGFKSNSPGYLYLLVSDCGGYLKVGVSNNIQRRFRELKYSTPFGFNAIRIKYFAIGQNAIQWEKIFHSTFKSANMIDFDGATEWLKWDSEIPLWFDFI